MKLTQAVADCLPFLNSLKNTFQYQETNDRGQKEKLFETKISNVPLKIQMASLLAIVFSFYVNIVI